MQRARIEVSDDYEYFESTEQSTETEITEAESTEHDSFTWPWETETETESESGGHGHGHGHGHHRGRGHGHGHRGRGHGHGHHRGRGHHDRGHGRHGQNVYPRRHKRKAIRPAIYRWTNKQIPYQIGLGFSKSFKYFVHKYLSFVNITPVELFSV